MPFSRDKLKTLAHYICWRCKEDPSKLGSVKLNKTLWLCDFTTYYHAGTAITGARYVKREFGPVPSALQPILRELELEGAIKVAESQFHGYKKKEFRVFSKPDMDGFGSENLETIENVIRFVCDQHSAKSISELSHDHIWQSAQEGEELPYFTIFSVPGEIQDDEREWARMELESVS